MAMFSSVLFLAIGMESVKADELSNAYKFYEMYGSEMLFQTGAAMEGEIYYATKAKLANTGIQYTTLGWKVSILDNEKVEIDTVYYQLGGDHMICVDKRNVDGYEYCLYKVTLQNLKSRMGTRATDVLNAANAQIIFDACTTTKINGELQGSMDDQGPKEGLVYETYDDIANAQKWSDSTKETLKTYYNKEVRGLFYNVTLVAGEGIQSVYGGGSYCFGATVGIYADAEKGYHFYKWDGKEGEQTTYFLMGAEDILITAYGEQNQYNIIFNTNGGMGEIPPLKIAYSQQMMLPSSDIYLDGYSLCGWSTRRDAVEPEYRLKNPVKIMDLAEKMQLSNIHNATIVLYAVWDHEPWIEGDDLYVSLEDAMNGKITEEWLAEHVQAGDVEDGEIPYGYHQDNSFWIIDYLATDFTGFTKNGAVTETFCAIDSVGNETQKRITVHIVDTSIYDAEQYLGYARFISKTYYKDETGVFIDSALGGLRAKSCWRTDSEYVEVLDALFLE